MIEEIQHTETILSILDADVILSKQEFRKEIIKLENTIKDIEGSYCGDTENCPLEHTFSNGIYVRRILIPKNNIIIGKIHLHEHPNFLMSGVVKIITDNGVEIIEAPQSLISPAGTKRILYAITDVVLTTVHLNPNNTRDLDELSKINVVDTYEEYDKLCLNNKNNHQLIMNP